MQGLIVSTLKASTDVSDFVHARVYDTVPKDAELPYISIGPFDAIEVDADCIRALQIFIQIDVWSQSVGLPECREIMHAVRGALHDGDFTLTDNALVMIEHESSRSARDADGITNHGVCEFVAVVEQPQILRRHR